MSKSIMKRETLRDKRRYVFKMDFRGPDANTYAQVLDSHLEALELIEELKDKLAKAEHDTAEGKPPPPPTWSPRLVDRDKSQDQPCDGCGKPLWRIHPDAAEELSWGHTTREDTERCPITKRRGEWPVPRDIREHTESEKWCRHPECKDSNWGGKDRMHLRGAECPPYDINPPRFVSQGVRNALLARALLARDGKL